MVYYIEQSGLRCQQDYFLLTLFETNHQKRLQNCANHQFFIIIIVMILLI